VSGVGRRELILGAAAALAAPALPRRAWAAASAASVESILAESGLAAVSGFAVADLDGDGLLEGHDPDGGRPPASVAKIVTALYARAALGPAYRFRTRVLAGGPVEGGVLRGDLVLEGGGDPVLDTDGLAALVASLRSGGIDRVEGRFLVADGALPFVADVARGQPEDAGYNPTISGMILNFNRVEVRWAPGQAPSFGAPGEKLLVPVSRIAGTVADGPIRHRFEAGREVWSLPAARMQGSGSDWLPVRAPAPYAGEVFAALAARAGLALPPAEVVARAGGSELAFGDSPALERMLRDMLRYSTNLTAESVGLRASQARGAAPGGVAASAAAMGAWARGRYGLPAATFVDHSGLGDGSRVAPAEMVTVLRRADGLAAMLRARPVLGADRRPVDLGVEVVAKTGTLFFACGLAGYMTGGRRLAFAIFSADAELRARIRPEERAEPPGAKSWAARARAQQQALLRRWAAVYA
jgi:D-alanyl-D-alanine carboxypeptidase/D-alanyl-D-alanine-endopeptidase (penicillin-binding protein 4)